MALYTDDTIHRVIEAVNQEYFLPDIQRSFVWKQDQIYALFDSIMRGYPINTFLFWKVNREYLQQNSIKRFKFLLENRGENDEESSFSDRDYFLVLDGQQRITTLNITLKGQYIERNKRKELFLDILSGKKENEDGLLYEFKFLDKIGELFFEENERLWVSVKRVYECKDDEEKRALRNEIKKLKPEFENMIEGNVDKLHSRLRGEELLNYYTEREKDYDKVLDIFVRTNSGGTKLTYSDLLFSTIKLKWKDARENFTNLLNDINGDVFNFDTDFVLKTCFVLFAETQQDIKYSKRNVDDQNKINNIINNWKRITSSIKITRDLLTKFGINHSKLLTSNNALIPLVYYIYKNDIQGFGDAYQRGMLSRENEELMKNFLINSLLTGLFGGSSDNILYLTKNEIDANSNHPYFPLGQISFSVKKKNRDMEITPEFLDDIKYNDKNSSLVLNLLYENIDHNSKSKNNLPEQDHLFCRDELEKAGFKEEDIDSIFNIRYVESGSNKRKSDQPFKEWIVTQSDTAKKLHLIPEGKWDVNNYQEFLNERKGIILSKIKDLFEQKVI